MASQARRDEVVGLFQDPQSFADAVGELEDAGFDRADISVLGERGSLRPCLQAVDCQSKARADDPKATHEAVILEEDQQQARVLFTSLASSIAAIAASGAALAATGGMAAPAVAAAFAAGGAVGGTAEFLSRRAGNQQAEHLKRQVERGGIVAWVAVDGAEEETKVETLFKRHGAQEVHKVEG